MWLLENFAYVTRICGSCWSSIKQHKSRGKTNNPSYENIQIYQHHHHILFQLVLSTMFSRMALIGKEVFMAHCEGPTGGAL